MLCAWLVAFAGLLARPTVAPGEVRGLYREADSASPYRWTSSRVHVPIHGRSGPTAVELGLAGFRWPGRAPPQVTLATDAGPLATLTLPDQVRRYRFLLPPASSALLLRTGVERPPGNDSRYLGVQYFGLKATPSGLPLRAAGLALLFALASVPLAFAAAWCIRRGYGVAVALLALALLLRVIMLRAAPPGFSQDEAVSLVDAWSLARTGRDHLGHLLPLGAQEALGDWISPLLTYLELPAVALFGPAPLVGRLVTALFGALAAPLAYRLTRALRLPVAAAVCAGVVTALSPWQIFLSRFALPPSLVMTSWTLCLLAALLFVQRGQRRAAVWLALAAGIALYAYPTMKLAAPLLVAWAVALALMRHGWRAGQRWLPAALLLALLWLPFGAVTLLNPASNTRLDQAVLRSRSAAEWLAAWWVGYSSYLRPDLYFISGDGDPIHGLLNRGVQLPAEAPLLAIGLAALAWLCFGLSTGRGSKTQNPSDLRPAPAIQNPKSKIQNRYDWWLMAGALLIAPLPASLTNINPHAFRAAQLAPMYALLVGLGTAALWRASARVPRDALRRVVRGAGVLLFGAALAWQAGGWYRDYIRDYPPGVAWTNQDGLLETIERAIAYAPQFDEVWISTDDITAPHIYLLAARPLPPEQAQDEIVVIRQPGHLNRVTSIGPYHFGSLAGLPAGLPTLEAVPDRFGGPAFVVQAWQQAGKRILVVRRMST